MISLQIIDENNQPDISGAILKIGSNCTYEIYFKVGVFAFLNCGGLLYILRKSDARFLITGEPYTNLINGNATPINGVYPPFASAAELQAWVELYFPVTNIVPDEVQTYEDLEALLPVTSNKFVTVVNDEENGTGSNDNYLYLLHASGVITWVAAQTQI